MADYSQYDPNDLDSFLYLFENHRDIKGWTISDDTAKKMSDVLAKMQFLEINIKAIFTESSYLILLKAIADTQTKLGSFSMQQFTYLIEDHKTEDLTINDSAIFTHCTKILKNNPDLINMNIGHIKVSFEKNEFVLFLQAITTHKELAEFKIYFQMGDSNKLGVFWNAISKSQVRILDVNGGNCNLNMTHVGSMMLKMKSSLEDLKLSGFSEETGDDDQFIAALQKSDCLEELYINGNYNLGKNALIRPLINGLKRNISLQRLTLIGCYMDKYGWEDLGVVVGNHCSIYELDLRGTTADHVSLAAFFTGLRRNKGLIRLGIGYGLMSVRDAVLYEAYLSNAPSIKQLEISPQSVMDDKSIDCFLRPFSKRTLSHLSLRGAWTDESIVKVAKHFSSSKELVAVHIIGTNKLKINGVKALADMIRQNKLGRLSLKQCELDDSAAEELAKALPFAKGLFTLDVRYNKFTKKGADLIKAALTNKALLHIENGKDHYMDSAVTEYQGLMNNARDHQTLNNMFSKGIKICPVVRRPAFIEGRDFILKGLPSVGNDSAAISQSEEPSTKKPRIHQLTEDRLWTPVYWTMLQVRSLLQRDDKPPGNSITNPEYTAMLIDRGEDGASWKDCAYCGKKSEAPNKNRKCGGCKKAYYCCKEHQMEDWIYHGYWCKQQSVTDNS